MLVSRAILYYPRNLHTGIAIRTNNDMIRQLYSHNSTSLRQLSRERNIPFRWIGTARGVVVDEDY